MHHWRHQAANLPVLFFLSLLFPLIKAQTPSNSTQSLSPDDTGPRTNPSVIVGSVFGAVIGVSLIMVSILVWVRRQTQKAREAGGTYPRKKGRYGTQNTSVGLDTSFAVPTGISSFNLEKKSVSTAPYSSYPTYLKAPTEARSYVPSRREYN